MQFAPVLWTVWFALFLLLIIVNIIAGRFARDEDDQLLLHDSMEHVRQEQAVIVARLNKVEPLKRILVWMLGAMTVVVAGYYLMDVYHQLFNL